MRIIIFGAPGSGKGTQAKVISSELNIPHISTGDILREAVKNETETGLKVKAILDRGELVPDTIMGELIKETLSDTKNQNGFILDGYPRTIDQAKVLKAIFDELNAEKPYLIKLDVADDVIVDRLSSRRTCSKCGHIINLKLDDDASKCEKCGAEKSFITRDDDKEDVIRHRLEVYHDLTSPVFEFFKDSAVIIGIDGTKPIEEISKDILEKLK